MICDEKLERLKGILRELGSVAVAFSGGVDSSLLLKTAADVLGDRAIAITAQAEIYPERELQFAADLAHSLGVRLEHVQVDPFALADFVSNPPNRCYHCKRAVFETILAKARELGFAHVADGSNADDAADWRPGMRATAELGIVSPLRDAGLAKAEIRELSRRMGLPTADLPSRACLASRVPYGTRITRDDLARIDQGEAALEAMGFGGNRIRHHGSVARVELRPSDIARAAEAATRARIIAEIKKLGYSYVALDLEGYRTGSLNEVLAETTGAAAGRGPKG